MISVNTTSSPSFSLFPSTPARSAHSLVDQHFLEPSLLNRSVTEHSRRLSRPKPAIKRSEFQDQDHILVVDVSQTPTSQSNQPDLDQSQRSETTSYSDYAGYSRHSSPNPEADTPSPRTSAFQQPLQCVFPTRKSSIKKLDTAGLQHRNQVEDSIGPSAEVSIARQISISRRQRLLLVPINAKTAHKPIQPEVKELGIADELRRSHQ